MAVIQAALTGCTRPSSTCLSQVRCGWPSGRLQSGAGRIPLEASMQSCWARWGESWQMWPNKEWQRLATAVYKIFQSVLCSRKTAPNASVSLFLQVSSIDSSQWPGLTLSLPPRDLWEKGPILWCPYSCTNYVWGHFRMQCTCRGNRMHLLRLYAFCGCDFYLMYLVCAVVFCFDRFSCAKCIFWQFYVLLLLIWILVCRWNLVCVARLM